MLWHSVSTEAPSRWVLYGREDSEATWVAVDTMEAPRSEPATYKHINRTCHSPGYYAQYMWQFSEWAPVNGNGDSTSDGHQLRDIILNPNGFAMHYGRPMTNVPVSPTVVEMGLTNLARGAPAYLSSVHENADWAMAWRATDGYTPMPLVLGWGCSMTQSRSGVKEHLVGPLRPGLGGPRTSLLHKRGLVEHASHCRERRRHWPQQRLGRARRRLF